MKRYLPLLFALTAFAFTGEDLTQNIKEAKIRIDLPNASWSLSDKRSEGDMSVYIFKREPVIDADGRQIIPNIAVIVEEVEKDLDVVEYTALKRSKVSFEVEKVYTSHDGTIA